MDLNINYISILVTGHNRTTCNKREEKSSLEAGNTAEVIEEMKFLRIDLEHIEVEWLNNKNDFYHDFFFTR